MPEEEPRLLVFGAHPDDAEFHAGGLISLYRDLGLAVKIVSVTDGAAGHHQRPAEELAAMRREEAAAVSRLIGTAYEIWEYPDARLQPTLDVRQRIVCEIRRFRPDLVLTHRPCDYHPDHRAVGVAVQDASYTVTVPLLFPDVPPLRRDPVVAYMVDFFTRPYPFSGDVVFDVAPQLETIVDMLDCHRSQVYEWLPYSMGILDEVPADGQERKRRLGRWYADRLRQVADRFREQLVRTYGEPFGNMIELAEAYEISEYAAPLDDTNRKRLFPFLP
jgi:LmbE family N-acetylglucosaminyl deacetylase